jgi:hypothetical protein
VNLNAHLLRLEEIREKMERGEEPNEAEAAYVRALWEAVIPVAKRLAEGIAGACGMTVEGLSARLEADAARSRRLQSEYEARMRRWGSR